VWGNFVSPLRIPEYSATDSGNIKSHGLQLFNFQTSQRRDRFFHAVRIPDGGWPRWSDVSL